MSIKAIIFDLDGTLLDTLDDLVDAGNLALADAGHSALAAGDFRLMIGAGIRNLIQRAIASASGVSREEITEIQIQQMLLAFENYYAMGWGNKTKPYPGILELLNQLKAAGLKLAILSNKPDNSVRIIAAHFFPKDCFAVVAGKKDDWPIKPDPGLALEICRQMAVSPAETVLVGDSGSDMLTAVRAGFLPVGVLWGYRDALELSSNGAAWLAQDSSSLGEYLMFAGNRV